MGIRVKVTQEHIDKAIDEVTPFAWSACVCPVAQAFRERFQVEEVYAMSDGVDVHFGIGKNVRYNPRHDSIAIFMSMFDSDPYSVEPTSFFFDLVED